MSQKKKSFIELVNEANENYPMFERTVPGRQVFIMFDANQLSLFTNLCSLCRKHKIGSESEAIAIAAGYFLNNVAEDESDEEIK